MSLPGEKKEKTLKGSGITDVKVWRSLVKEGVKEIVSDPKGGKNRMHLNRGYKDVSTASHVNFRRKEQSVAEKTTTLNYIKSKPAIKKKKGRKGVSNAPPLYEL